MTKNINYIQMEEACNYLWVTTTEIRIILGGLVVHGVGRGVVRVLAHERAVAAQRDRPQRVVDVLAAEAEQLRPEAHREFDDADAAQPPDQVVAELVGGHDEAEHQHGDGDVEQS